MQQKRGRKKTKQNKASKGGEIRKKMEKTQADLSWC